MAPQSSLDVLRSRYLGRQVQIDSLSVLLQPTFPTPSNLVVHGPTSTGKTAVVSALLLQLDVKHAFVDTRLCINGRQLLDDIWASCCEALKPQANGASDQKTSSRCDSLNALQANLEVLLGNHPSRFVVVLDAVDRQRDAPPTLLPALVRFAEFIPNLTIIFIISVPSPRLFHTQGIPHIEFPTYTRDDILAIMQSHPPPGLPPPSLVINGDEDGSEISPADIARVWSQYCAVIWDSIGKNAARDLTSFKEACNRLWVPFTQPLADRAIRSKDFAKLLVKGRPLLQGEDALLDDYSLQTKDKSGGLSRTIPKAIQELPYYTKFVLIAAYLASYNPTRLDILYFMKSTDRKRRRKQNGAGSKVRKIPRNLLAPAPFPLDRLLAITSALLPDPLPRSVALLGDIATLVSLKLLLRSAGGNADPLDPSAKFRVNVGWDFVVQCGRSVSLDVRDYAAWVAA